MEEKILYSLDNEEDTLIIYKDQLFVRQDKEGKHGEGRVFIADIKPVSLMTAEEERRGVLEFVTVEGVDIKVEFYQKDNQMAKEIYDYLLERTAMYNEKSKEAKDAWAKRRKKRNTYSWIALVIILAGIYFAFIQK